jgi:DNA-binding NtrC family response regulator
VKPLFVSRNRDTAALATTLARLGRTSLPIILEGETGAGKTFIAAAIHRCSRPGTPQVLVDCGAIPETLLAAELFGHRAGAFTDATRAREGWLARGAEGTVVLERIDSLSLGGQVALLRVLEDRVFVPVGGGAPRRLDARVLATASPGLDELVRAGAFRADLYHRLAGMHARIPPLRHRREDILPLARAAVKRLARRSGAPRTLSAEAEALLAAYPWPGNIRELETTIDRACLTGAGESITAADLALPAGVWPAVAGLAAERAVPAAEVTRLYGLLVLARHAGNVTQAARALGVSRRTLIRWRRSP